MTWKENALPDPPVEPVDWPPAKREDEEDCWPWAGLLANKEELPPVEPEGWLFENNDIQLNVNPNIYLCGSKELNKSVYLFFAPWLILNN